MPTPKRSKKKPFDIERAIDLLREAIKPFPKAALFQLFDEGYTSVFELLCAAILSIRTRDETTLPVSRKLFAEARTPAAVGALTPTRIDALIRDCTFHEAKSYTIHEIAKRAAAEFGGEL